MSARKDLASRIKRAQVEAMVKNGFSLSRISKETGIGYRHVKNIYQQMGSSK